MTDQEYLQSLEAPPPHFGGTGAVKLVPDPRDYIPQMHPKVRAVLEVGAVNFADRSSGACEILNQGPTGACVPNSTCGGIQLDHNLERQVCYHFNAQQLYSELGGTGSNGIDSRACLQKCVDVGAPLRDGGRVKTGSYFKIDNIPGVFEEQIKAAIVAGQVVVIAMLLPSTFSGKWTPGAVTSAYHQVEISGFRDRLFWGPNSWGAGWPGSPGEHPPGFYECSFDYAIADGNQRGYCYAFFFDPVEAHGPPPPPPPPPVILSRNLTGVLRGEGLTAVVAGQVMRVDGNKTLEVKTITDGDTEPPPPPDILTVSGYSANPVKSGQVFQVLGSGFNSENFEVEWSGQILKRRRVSTTVIEATAPDVTMLTVSLVNVRVEGATATGPSLTVKPADTLAVTGYSANPVESEQVFQILGTGFNSNNIDVTWGDTWPLENEKVISPTVIEVTAPNPLIIDSKPIRVRVEGGVAIGPNLSVIPGDGNGNGGGADIPVRLYLRRIGARLMVWAYVQMDGQPSATARASVSGTDAGERVTGANGVATWSVTASSPATVTVDVTRADGKRGHATKTEEEA